MVKRITTISELKTLSSEMKKEADTIAKITKNQKHVFGEWNIDHIHDQVLSSFILNKDKSVIVAYYKDDKPASVFTGLIAKDFSCNKIGLFETHWFTVRPTMFGGTRILQEVEKIILEKNIDFLSMTYMCNGGDPRIQGFYMNNGFRLNTLSFIKSYK
jgi:hypothetical protein